MDERLFGSTEMGDQSFQLTVGLLETLLGEIVTCYPDQVRTDYQRTITRTSSPELVLPPGPPLLPLMLRILNSLPLRSGPSQQA